MKLLYTLLLSLMLTGIYTTAAQTPTAPQVELGTGKDSTYYAQYNKLKQLYIARIHSPSYIKLREAIQNYKKNGGIYIKKMWEIYIMIQVL